MVLDLLFLVAAFSWLEGQSWLLRRRPHLVILRGRVRNGSDNDGNQAAAHPHEGRSHSGSPFFAQRLRRAGDVKAALTRCPTEGEFGADFCLLGIPPLSSFEHASGAPFSWDTCSRSSKFN